MNYRQLFYDIADVYDMINDYRTICMICNKFLDVHASKTIPDQHLENMYEYYSIPAERFDLRIEPKMAAFLLNTKVDQAMQFIIWNRPIGLSSWVWTDLANVDNGVDFEIELMLVHEAAKPTKIDILKIFLITMEAKEVKFDKAKYDKLVKEYQAAVDSSKEEFVLDGDIYYTSYAKYLIEYMQPRFGEK